MDIKKYSEQKLFEIIKAKQYQTRRSQKFEATCPFCLHKETAYVSLAPIVAESLAKSKIVNHIKSVHREHVDLGENAHP